MVLGGLDPLELAVLARLRLAVTARLCSLAGNEDAGSRPARGGLRSFTLGLSASGVPAVHVRNEAGRFEAFTGGAGPGGLDSLRLLFGPPDRCARILLGGRGTPLPLFCGPGAFEALAWFRAASARLPRLLADAATPVEFRARLLATAAVAGLAEVGSADPWLADRLDHAPDGTVLVECPSCFAYRVAKAGRGLRVLDGPAGAKGTAEAEGVANARLTFRDAATAVAVFSGARPAILSLAGGEVRISGLVPLVQGLFAVLDRLGAYMAVTIDGRGVH